MRLGAIASVVVVGLVACSFTDLDALSHSAASPGTTNGADASVVEDAGLVVEDAPDSGPQDSGVDDADVVDAIDAGSEDAGDGDAATVFVPQEGAFTYVQNTAAYAAGEFASPPEKLGIDYMSIEMCASQHIDAVRAQAASMPASILYDPPHADGTCWTFHIDIHPDDAKGGHQENESFCARDGALFARGSASTVQDQTWEFGGAVGTKSARATTVCDRTTLYLSPTMKVGDGWAHACTGSTTATKDSYQSSGPLTYLGRVTMTVDGVDEDAFHLRRDRTVSGGTKGREVTEFYLSVTDAMPLRIHRWTQIVTPITIPCINQATYNNYGSDWLLESRTARPKDGGA